MARSSNVDRIIEQILASDRLKASAHFSSAVYGNEPILRTAAQMSRFLPERCREMREMARRPEALSAPESWLFREQARFMADFEDDFPEDVPFERYYPTYQAMNDRQLRCYFTWRTQVRHGTVRETSLSYVFTYLYELVNLVGCAGAEDAFGKLRAFWQEYRAIDTHIDRYARTWLRDLTLYHGLSPQLLADSTDAAFDEALIALAEAEAAATGTAPAFLQQAAPNAAAAREGKAAPQRVPDAVQAGSTVASAAEPGAAKAKRPRKRRVYDFAHPPYPEDRLFNALAALSAYRIEAGRLYKEQPRIVQRATCAIFMRLAQYYRSNRKTGLTESLFGSFSTLPYRPFETAVFFEDGRHPDATWQLSPVDVFLCARGHWWRRCFHGARDRSPRLGRLMRTIDRELRRALAFPYPLKDGTAPKYLQKIVEQELTACLAWEKEHAPRVIHIDRSKLSGIRSAAASTREALLVDEERAPAPLPEDKKGVSYGPRTAARTAGDPAASTPAEGADPVEASPGQGGSVAAPDVAAPAQETLFPTPAVMNGAAHRGNAGADASSSAVGPALSAAERALLAALLNGRDPAPALAQAGMLPSVFIDQLNEKLFDVVGDTVVELDGENPVLVEDYHEDVEALLRETA